MQRVSLKELGPKRLGNAGLRLALSLAFSALVASAPAAQACTVGSRRIFFDAPPTTAPAGASIYRVRFFTSGPPFEKAVRKEAAGSRPVMRRGVSLIGAIEVVGAIRRIRGVLPVYVAGDGCHPLRMEEAPKAGQTRFMVGVLDGEPDPAFLPFEQDPDRRSWGGPAISAPGPDTPWTKGLLPVLLQHDKGLVFEPRWRRRPTDTEMRVLYPPDALRNLQEGKAVVVCHTTFGGALQACSLVSEEPGGAGFGAAALSAATRYFQLDLRPEIRPGDVLSIRLPVRFQLPKP